MITSDAPLLLGSASPRRREILETARIPLRIAAVAVDEGVRAAEGPAEYLGRVVASKLDAVVVTGSATGCSGILVADTTVVVDGEILGKPSTIAEAAGMVGRLVGRVHSVLTRYAIRPLIGTTVATTARTIETRVTLRGANAREVERYAATGEGLDKAGAYAVQGIGAFLVERIDGSYSNVVGLPICEVLLDLMALRLLTELPR
ncbi:MAG: septum formation protein Maf [Polyangiaceae bacterium]|nr:septum formation protein Maf [Polyangiaceae bacterium]